MDKNINLLAIVPARKGSKRVKNKNLQLVGQKSLVERTIIELKKSNIDLKIIISTDCHKCLDIANNLGVSENVLRDKNLSNDKATTDQVIEHELNRFYSENKYIPTFVGVYQTTSPFRRKKHIEESFEKFVNDKFSSLVSVCQVGNKHIKFAYKNVSFLTKEDDSIFYNYDNEYLIRNGAIYLTKSDYFMQSKKIINYPLGFYSMDQIGSINIDTYEDLFLAQAIGQNYD